jgi:hypothetical protein
VTVGRSALALLGLALAAGASAQSVYTCKDRYGHIISSDRPMPECADRAIRETSPGGLLKREIAAPLTPEQQAQKELDDKNRRVVEDAAREKRRRDSALLAAYANEDAIDAARRRAIADANETLAASRQRLADLTKEKAGIVEELKAYKGKIPPIAQRKADDNDMAIADESASIKARETEIDRINTRYDEERKRYRELSTAPKGK